MGWLSDLFRGGRDELGWDDLIRRSVDAVAALGRHGARGEVLFPPDVTLRITVAEGSVRVVQELVERPELDREVEAGLANRCDVDPARLPLREYVVSPADRTTVTAIEGSPSAWQVEIDGGDLAGHIAPLPLGSAELTFGRGAWHGDDQQTRNDLVVCQQTEFVSRRAGRLHRSGHQLEVASLDQGDELVLRRRTGETVRPSRTARGRVVVRPGDAVELGDGRGATVRLRFERTSGAT